MRWRPGNFAYTKGLDYNCNPVICVVVFQHYLTDNNKMIHRSPDGVKFEIDCVVQNDGIEIKMDSSRLCLHKSEVSLSD